LTAPSPVSFARPWPSSGARPVSHRLAASFAVPFARCGRERGFGPAQGDIPAPPARAPGTRETVKVYNSLPVWKVYSFVAVSPDIAAHLSIKTRQVGKSV